MSDKEIDDIVKIEVECDNGKKYVLDNELPVKAYRLMKSNINILIGMLPNNAQGQDPDIHERAEKVLNYIISYANIAKYPELTPEYISKQFEEKSFDVLNMMYIAAWTEIANKQLSTVTPPPESDKKKAGE